MTTVPHETEPLTGARPRRRGGSLKRALLQIHSVFGLVAALALALIGITGAILGFEDEIRAGLNADLTRVAARPGVVMSPDALLARLHETTPGRVSALTLSRDPTAAVLVRFARTDEGRPASLYIDPYDARPLGAPRAEAFFVTVRKLHRWLLLPNDGNGIGRPLVGGITIGLIGMLMTGLVLRWPRRAGSPKAWLKPQWGAQGRTFQRSLHEVVATWILPLYLVMALTGLWFSFEWYRNGVTAMLARQPPAKAMSMQPRAKEAAEAPALELDKVWATFLREQGERYAEALLTLPASGTSVRVRAWTQAGRHDGTRDEFRIDGVTGRLISSELYANRTFGERVIARVLDLHRGSILGWPGQLLFAIAAGLMPLFAVTGIVLYVLRRRHRAALAHAAALHDKT